MEKYYRQRFIAQRRLIQAVTRFMEADEILETVRSELKQVFMNSMEACILLLDPDARKYTRPLQCALYDRPVDCLNCKRNRPAIQKAVSRKKAVVVSAWEPGVRHDGTRVPTGPEAAIPVYDENRLLAAISVVDQPGRHFSHLTFLLLKDSAETVELFLVNAKKHWADTRLSAERPGEEMNHLVERLFSVFVDPIPRYQGDINETAGDGLMIVFQDTNTRANAINAVRAAIEIRAKNRKINRESGQEASPVYVNMGINAGEALVGMTRMKGSLDTRITYAASGSVTNLAARLAAQAKGGDIRKIVFSANSFIRE